jgi:UDP-N-acetylglucosamine:LPS N-acetylglucosamine transferase
MYRVSRPRGKHTKALGALYKTILAGLESIRVFWQIRPAAVVGTGPALVVPVAIVGRLFGSRIIYIETGSRVNTLSMTGRIMYWCANMFFVQWPQLAEQWPRAIYAGRLL